MVHEERRYQTIVQAARTLGVPEYRIRVWAKTGCLPGFMSGSRCYVDVVRLRQKLEEGGLDGKQI